MKIALDVDEVLADTINGIIRFYNNRNGTSYRREDFHSYEWENVWGGTRQENIQLFYDFMNYMGKDVPTIEGAVSGVKQLSREHELIAITARQYEFEDLTRDWIWRNFGDNIRDVVLTNSYSMDGGAEISKALICKKLGVELAVDDLLRHVEKFASEGISALLYDCHWNKKGKLPSGVRRVKSWEEITSILMND